MSQGNHTDSHSTSALETHFARFRKHIIGIDHHYSQCASDVLYADWTASGRLYRPIEDFICNELGPYVANTHTESNLTGTTMTKAYDDARALIKAHVNAGKNDVLIAAGAGMTTVINKLQRMMGLRVPCSRKSAHSIPEAEKPLVLISHMEHHSNQTTWNECDVVVEIVKADAQGLPSLSHLETLLKKHAHRRLKIGSFTACSNVTGIKTPIHQMASLMHQNGGVCFVDYAAAAPYVRMDMHPVDPLERLDAIFISPHKFLGGPGSSGILIFDKSLYCCNTPDQPGGGTVSWTNPWGEQRYFDDIEAREDGGTPGFLQTIRAALAIKVKDEMGVAKIAAREEELKAILLDGLESISNLHVLQANQRNRLCIVSFYITDVHFNLVVKLLNDRFGVQARGGCSCAGTYGHMLLNVDQQTSRTIADKIECGDLTDKPGWIRISLHPTDKNTDAYRLVEAIRQISENAADWAKDYDFKCETGEYLPKFAQPELVSLEQFSSPLT